MADRIEFDINESLKLYLSDPASIQTQDAFSGLQNCENEPDSLSEGIVNDALEQISDAIAESSEAVNRTTVFDNLQFLLK